LQVITKNGQALVDATSLNSKKAIAELNNRFSQNKT